MTSSGRRKVVVAMSGGVDSSVAAALLVREGYEVIGLMMRLWSEPHPPPRLRHPSPLSPWERGEGPGVGGEGHNRCCTPEAVAQARRVSETLDIPFYVIDAQAPFKARVVDFFVDGYASGVTPNPCLECNRHIRWEFLLNTALSLGADSLATGHYARVRRSEHGYQLLKAVDRRKDQSYVLSVLGQTQLKRAGFPVGEYTKPQVRGLAREFGLPVAERAESQDLCFVADGDYRRFLDRHAPGVAVPGPILTVGGERLGEHRGLPFYTIGQRKGIGVAAAEPLYVLATDPARNALIVGPAEQLGRNRLTARRVNWVSGAPPGTSVRAGVKIRYSAAEAPATLIPLPDSRVEVRFDHNLRDITPGQAAVFYDGEVCLGGGIIE